MTAGYVQGTASVTTTPAKLLTVPAGSTGVLVNNQGSVAVVVGSSTVTATGATAGPSVAAGATVLVPSLGGVTHDLWAVTPSSTASVAYLAVSD